MTSLYGSPVLVETRCERVFSTLWNSLAIPPPVFITSGTIITFKSLQEHPRADSIQERPKSRAHHNQERPKSRSHQNQKRPNSRAVSSGWGSLLIVVRS
eukprot:sb/3478585/